MDQATTPNVTLSSRADPIHNGSFEYRVRGEVFDVRTHELNLSLSLNGENRTLVCQASTKPGTIGHFEVNVTLEQRTNRIVISATDPNQAWAPSDDELTPSPSIGQSTLFLDADGLTDRYENTVIETNPLDPDSDSRRTTVSESDNGVIDGYEDFDSEGLRTALEAKIGTDPFDQDTDDDRLTDSFEHRFRTIEPLSRDTDADGRVDWKEDPDNETLRNLAEQRHGTHPLESDTDNDTLSDAYEVRTTFTSPTNRDSDTNRTPVNESGNGVIDGDEDFDAEGLRTAVEANIRTNPFDPDTDDDQLTDRFEHQWRTMQPLDADTDGDGVNDAREDPDGETLVNLDEQRHSTSPLDPDSDDDNLTDAEEVATTETAPLIPDSDSGRTRIDESGNGIIDGGEDFDDDNLSTAVELSIGTAPFDPDTDGDQLRDGFEHRYDTINPLETDTDGDGVNDAREDPDGETLLNLGEQTAQTNPLDPDTDDDNLTDAYEVHTTETNPLDPDSDSDRTAVDESDDNVLDGAEDFDDDNLTASLEAKLATSPFDADTDGESLEDGFEHFWSETDPTNPDSDGDGVLDAEEDHDNDALSTGQEQTLRTDPLDPDTDSDQLWDGFEVKNSTTSPRSKDSDANGTSENESGEGVIDSAEDFDNDNLAALAEQRNGTQALEADTDSDGLADGFEVKTAQTDPTDPDSDSALTDADESGDGVYDSREDLDGDRLFLRLEAQYGTSVSSQDTDEDGLPDRSDALLPTYDPLVSDSDNDGVQDGNEDLDDDDLSNVRELDYGTTLTVADTDGDGIFDGVEIGKFGSNATDPMTDSDELTDGEEIELGTDPSSPDTDGDGTLDHNETFTTRTKDKSSGAMVEATGEGSAATQVSVDNSTADPASDTRASHVLTVTGAENTSRTEVTIPYAQAVQTSSTDTQIDDPTVYVWNPRTKSGWESVPTTENSDGTVTATIDQDGFVVVRDEDTWQNKIHGNASVNAPLLIDAESGDVEVSAWEPCEPNQQCNGGTTTTTESTTTTSDPYDPTSTTTTEGDEPVLPSESVTLSTEPANVLLIVKPATDRGATVTVSGQDGEETFASDGERIRRTLAEYQGEEITVTYNPDNLDYVLVAYDTDGDTIIDSVERAAENMQPVEGIDMPTLDIQPDQADTDGDGLDDNQEVSLSWTYDDRVYVSQSVFDTWSSHPGQANSDEAGLDDGEEARRGSDPWTKQVLIGGYNVPTFVRNSTKKPMLTQETTDPGNDDEVRDHFIIQHSEIYLNEENSSCSCDWMNGIAQEEIMEYVRIPITVYLKANQFTAANQDAEYEINIYGSENVEIVKQSSPLDGEIDHNEYADRGYIVVEIDIRDQALDHAATFASMGQLGIEFRRMDDSVFKRSENPEVKAQYAVDGTELLDRLQDMLKRTQAVFDENQLAMLAIKKLYSFRYEGQGGTVKERVAFWQGRHTELADEVSTPPTSGSDIALEITSRGISYFIDESRKAERLYYPDDANVSIGGSSFIRVN
jgi:hypothetical protein